jgi:hypothetical protein
MSKTSHWRRQAELCLRLSQLCGDEPVSRHLSVLAAQYHETAVGEELGTFVDGVPNATDEFEADHADAGRVESSQRLSI